MSKHYKQAMSMGKIDEVVTQSVCNTPVTLALSNHVLESFFAVWLAIEDGRTGVSR